MEQQESSGGGRGMEKQEGLYPSDPCSHSKDLDCISREMEPLEDRC